MSDRSAEDPPRSSSHFQSQNRLHQHLGRRAARGNAVSNKVSFKGSYLLGAIYSKVITLADRQFVKFKVVEELLLFHCSCLVVLLTVSF